MKVLLQRASIWWASIALACIFDACGKPNTTSLAAPPKSPTAGSEKETAAFRVITASQLAEMLPAKSFTMVNVHTPDVVNIPQTDLNIPFDQMAKNLSKLPRPDAPIVIYCRSGKMSREATLTLTKLGYTNVTDVEGGFQAWIALGRETVPVR